MFEQSIEQFIEMLNKKQEAIMAFVLKQHPYPSDFQMLPGEMKDIHYGHFLREVCRIYCFVICMF